MKIDEKAIRKALMTAKNLAVSVDPGFSRVKMPESGASAPLERASGGEARPFHPIGSPEREKNLSAFMEKAHPSMFDESGKPKVFYHGTAVTSIRSFKGGRGVAGHFGLSPRIANEWAKARHENEQETLARGEPDFGDAAVVYPVHISAKNPFDKRNPHHLSLVGLEPHEVREWEELEQNLPILKKHGFDSYWDWEDGNLEEPSGIAVFDSKNIKSASGNRGTFSGARDDISKADGGQVEPFYPVGSPERDANLQEHMKGNHFLVPKATYLGSLGDWKEFDLNKANPESDMGPGIYSSSSTDDVRHNYAGFGPDMRSKINKWLEDRNMGDISYASLTEGKHDPEDFYQEHGDYPKTVLQQLHQDLGIQHEGATYKVHLSLKNPVVFAEGTRHQAHETEWYHDLPRKNSKSVPALIDALSKAAKSLNFPEDNIRDAVGAIVEHAADEGSVSATKLKDIFDNHIYPDWGIATSGELFKEAMRRLKFDGVVDARPFKKWGPRAGFSGMKIPGMPGVEPDTMHFVVWDSDQIKSATGNRGTYKKGEGDITKAEGGEIEQPAKVRKPSLSTRLRREGVSVENRYDAMKRFSNGERLFVYHEMDQGERPRELTSIDELNMHPTELMLSLPVGKAAGGVIQDNDKAIRRAMIIAKERK